MKTQFVDITGYSFSGKTAVYEYVSHLEGFHGFGSEVEFDIIRAPGGLLDLKHGLVSDWSLHRSTNAVQNFKRLIYFLGGKKNFFDRLTRGGSRYGEYFPDLGDATQELLNEFILAKWVGYWPFSDYTAPPFLIPFFKLLDKLSLNNKDVFLARVSERKFMEVCQRYMYRLITSAVPASARAIVTSNAFDPSAPQPSMALVHSSKCIVVDRDPRDVYISAMQCKDRGIGRAAVGDDVESFIRRFATARTPQSGPSDEVLRIFFEDFVVNHEKITLEIKTFLGMSSEEITLASQWSTANSINNVGMWRRNRFRSLYKDDIKVIESQLERFLVDIFEK